MEQQDLIRVSARASQELGAMDFASQGAANAIRVYFQGFG